MSRSFWGPILTVSKFTILVTLESYVVSLGLNLPIGEVGRVTPCLRIVLGFGQARDPASALFPGPAPHTSTPLACKGPARARHAGEVMTKSTAGHSGQAGTCFALGAAGAWNVPSSLAASSFSVPAGAGAAPPQGHGSSGLCSPPEITRAAGCGDQGTVPSWPHEPYLESGC